MPGFVRWWVNKLCEIVRKQTPGQNLSVKIYVSKAYNCDEVKNIIYNTLGIISEVEFSGG